ncbi:ninja-family protein MODD-like isoform X1 [Hordeum vulgare subsp. vulgare]|uniref:ninja-family protein MODD-like isoform X1 n=1 Tax=Hordeum vulgare subsp. vulgare TaxID=112509 RepID=UPI00162B7B98|nr:ninja-family protein MODD-like isoform X1 [Hordeum vulgare subsp. vulgare]
MEAYSKDMLRGVGAGDDGEEKVQRSASRTEEVDLSLGLSLGGRFGAERRSGDGLAGSSSAVSIQEVAPAPPAPVIRTNTAPTMVYAGAGSSTATAFLRNGAVVQRSATTPTMAYAGAGSSTATAFLRNGAVVQPSATVPQGSGVPVNGVVVEPLALLRATVSAFLGSAGQVRPSATPGSCFPLTLSSIKEEPVANMPSQGSPAGQGILTNGGIRNHGSLPAGIEGWLRMRKSKNLKRLETKRRIQGLKPSMIPDASQGSFLPRMPKRQNADLKGTPGAEGRSLSAAVMSWPVGTNGVVATASSSASAVVAAALGSGGERQHAPDMPAMMVQEMPLVWTIGLPNGRRAVGWLYEYSKVDEVRIKCVCHGSFFNPAQFVEHAGGGQVANPLRSILVKPPY